MDTDEPQAQVGTVDILCIRICSNAVIIKVSYVCLVLYVLGFGILPIVTIRVVVTSKDELC